MALGTRKVGVERSGFELVAMVAKKKYSGSWKIQEGVDGAAGASILSVE